MTPRKIDRKRAPRSSQGRARRTDDQLIVDLEAQLATLEERVARRREHSPRRLLQHREQLQLSAEDYGLLVGVSAQTIYSWEKGRSRPRARQLRALEAVSGLDRRRAWARLEEMGY